MRKAETRFGSGILVVIMAWTALAASPARALEVGALAGLDLGSRTVEPEIAGTVYSGGTSLMGGLFFQAGLMPGFTWEINALLQGREVKGSVGVNETFTRASYWSFPLIARFWLGDFLSVGAGPYFNFISGDVEIETKNPGGTTITSASASAQGLRGSDFGLLGSAQLKLGLAPALSALVDVRYVLGLTDFDSSDVSTQHWRDVQILAGISLGF